MTIKMPITEARHKLTDLPEEFQRSSQRDAVAVTRRGEPVLAILPWELYDSLVETLEILSDPEFMTDLRKSIQEAKEEKFIPWEKVKKGFAA